MSITLKGRNHAITLAHYAPSMDWPDVAGIYAFVDCSVAPPVVVFVAQTTSFRASMPGNPHWVEAARLGATHIFAAENAGDRNAIVEDLIATYQPALANPGPRRTAQTGINDILDSMTERPERAPDATGVHDILDAMFAQSNPADKFGYAQFEQPGAVKTRFGAQDRNPEPQNRSSPGDAQKRRGLFDHLFSAVHSRRS